MIAPIHPAPHALRRGNGLPLYQQIRQKLMDQIRSGAFKPNEPLPSIQAIAMRIGVSQMTVRQAMKLLTDQGIIYSIQGKGTFISGMKLEKEFRQVLSFSEETRAHGSVPHSKLISFNLAKPSEETRTALGLGAKDRVFRLRRVRYADRLPIGIECSCIPANVCPDLMSSFDPDSSLYEELANYGIQLMVTDEVIEVGKANAEESRLLQIALHSPVFLFTRVSFRENGQPIEHVKSTYRGDHYKIVNRLMRTRRDMLNP